MVAAPATSARSWRPTCKRRSPSSPLTITMTVTVKNNLTQKNSARKMPVRMKMPARLTLPSIKMSTMTMRMPLLMVVVVVVVVMMAQGPLLAHGELRPQSELSSNCFNFPEDNFDPENCIAGINDGNTPYLPMTAGDDAIDFTLHDLDGNAWNLGKTLEATQMPVVMIWGMLTCPGFQGLGTEAPWDRCSYWEEHSLVEEYKDRATFVHLYGAEPHPSSPETNFDKGVSWQSFWSVIRQPRSYDERVEMAARISNLVHPAQTILTDYFPGNPYSDLIQPVWCSYIMGARGVTVVSPDGTIFFQRGWFHSEHTASAIDKYWCEQLAQEEEEEEEGVEGEGGAQFAQVVRERSDASAANGVRGDSAGGGVVTGGGPVPVDTTASRARAKGSSATEAVGEGYTEAAGVYHGRDGVEQKVIVGGDAMRGFYSDLSCAGVSDGDGVDLDVPPLAGMFAGGGAAAPPVGTGS